MEGKREGGDERKEGGRKEMKEKREGGDGSKEGGRR